GGRTGASRRGTSGAAAAPSRSRGRAADLAARRRRCAPFRPSRLRPRPGRGTIRPGGATRVVRATRPPLGRATMLKRLWGERTLPHMHLASFLLRVGLAIIFLYHGYLKLVVR